MEKIILKKITSIFISICILMFILFSIIIFYSKSNFAIRDLDQMIAEVELVYNKSKVDTEKTEELFKDDYLNRTYAIEFIVSNNYGGNLNNELLQKIKKLMEVEAIHIIDSNGEIKLSSDLESLGLNLMNYNQSKEFWDLIKTDDKSRNVIQLNGKSILENKEKIYIGVKCNTDKYSVVQIELDKKVLDNYLYNNYITTIVKNIPTVYKRTVFIVNKNTANIDAITQNNEQDVVLENVNNENEFLEKLYSCTDGKLIKVNNKFKYLKTKNIENYIIAAYVDADEIYEYIIIDLFYLLNFILLILISILIIFKNCIKRYIIKDIFSIKSNIKELMEGNYDVEFKTEYDTELREISNVLNSWKESYRDRSERMTRVMASINSHISVFECLYTINRNFFSDNVKEMLGLDDKEWKKISKTPKIFENYIHLLFENCKSNDELIVCNDKFLNIVFFKEKDQFYGMIMDKTEDEKLKREIEKELVDKEIEAQTDSLTKLLNRLGFENSISGILENTSGKGILIMFDLDNFKIINDELGHPVGDEVLKKFSHCLKLFFTKNAFISRIAGDEFIVFVDEYIDKDALEEKLKNLMKKIHEDLYEYHINYKLSTSIGAIYVDKGIDTYEEIYRRADDALYKAKKLGKNTFYII